MKHHLLLAAVIAAALLPACRKNAPKLSPAEIAAKHVQGTPHTDEVTNAWRGVGLPAEGFVPVEPPPNSAAYCEHGKVQGVDTLVCEYASDDAIAQGIEQVKQGWARVDAHTGVVLRAKRTLMVVVDRERREPSGKTINQMAKAFSKL